MQKILALLIVLAGAAGGGALGIQLRPADSQSGTEPEVGDKADPGEPAVAAPGQGGDAASPIAPAEHTGGHAPDAAAGDPGAQGNSAGSDRDYVKLAREVVVPVVHERETQALMLFELAVDVPRGAAEQAYAAEPRLRDAFLRELMTLSYSGAFLTTYTDDRVMAELRGRLSDAARKILGDDVSDVLILDVVRQEL